MYHVALFFCFPCSRLGASLFLQYTLNFNIHDLLTALAFNSRQRGPRAPQSRDVRPSNLRSCFSSHERCLPRNPTSLSRQAQGHIVVFGCIPARLLSCFSPALPGPKLGIASTGGLHTPQAWTDRPLRARQFCFWIFERYRGPVKLLSPAGASIAGA